MMTDRPALHCPGHVQPVAGELTWPGTKQSIWPKQKGVTLDSQEVQTCLDEFYWRVSVCTTLV